MTRKRLIRTFLIRAAIIFVVWQVSYHGFIKPNKTVDDWLTGLVINSTVIGLELVGFDSYGEDNVIYINGKQSVKVANPCNGLELFVLFVGFLIAFPGEWKSKVIYSAIGVLLICLVNIIREMALALNYNYWQRTFDLNHKYTYTLIVYGIVFLIWRHWLTRYSIIGEKYGNQQAA